MHTLRLTLAYDGTRFAGWQIQKDQTSKIKDHKARIKPQREKPTIQGTLEVALQRILREHVKVVGSGRTDAGVHALAQVAHIRTHSEIACARLLRSVNALLPRDIAVTQIEDEAPTFHARFSARTKRYRYRIFTGPVVPPFIRPYVHHVRTPLALARMRREAQDLIARHDFRAFARTGSTQGSTVRSLSDVSVRRRGEEIQIEVAGNGFLHTMVRSIVGTLIDVGRGHRPPGTIQQLLRTGERRLSGTTAPAKGLALVMVGYAGERDGQRTT